MSTKRIVWPGIILLIYSCGMGLEGMLAAQEILPPKAVEFPADYTTADWNLPASPALADYEEALLYHNPEVRSAYETWRAQVRQIAVSRSLPDPKISLGYFIRNVETAVGPQQYKIGLSQMIPWFGKLSLQGDIQAGRAQASYEQLQTMLNSRILELRRVYYDAYYLERAVAITRQNLDLLQNWGKVILAKYSTGTARHANLVKTQIEVIKLEDDLETLKETRRPLLASLRALLNRNDLEKINLPDSLDFRPLAVTKDEVFRLVLDANPGLAGLRSLNRVAEQSVTRAKLNYLPDFSLGLERVFTGDKLNVAGVPVPGSGKDPLVVSGSLTIPLWFGRQSAEVNRARHLEQKSQADLESGKNGLRRELESLWFELEKSRRRVSLYQDQLIPRSLESLRAVEKSYIGGEMDFLNLIDAQRRHLEFTLSLEKSLVEYHKAKARLEALAGRNL